SGFLVGIFEVFAGVFHMLARGIVFTACNTPKFYPPKREFIFDNRRRVPVVAKSIFIMNEEHCILSYHVQIGEPFLCEILPIVLPFDFSARFAEELQFHLIEFTGPESEVARRNLVTERFTHLTDAERKLLAHCTLCILVVDENALCCFGTQE